MQTSRTRSGRLRRPVALATAAVVAAMLIPAGAAVADEGETDPNAVVDVQAVPDQDAQQSDPQVSEPQVSEPQSSGEGQNSTAPVTTAPASEQDTSPTTVPAGTEDATDSGDPVDTDVASPQPPATTTAAQDGLVTVTAEPDDRTAPPQYEDFRVTGYTESAWGSWQAVVGQPLTAEPINGTPAGTEYSISWFGPDGTLGTGPTYIPRADHLGSQVGLDVVKTVDNVVVGRLHIMIIATTIQLPAMPGGDIQIVNGDGFALSYGEELKVLSSGFAENADYDLRWTIDGVQVGTGWSFTPSAGQIGRFVDLEYTVTAKGYETYKSTRPIGWVQAEPTVSVSAATVTTGSTPSVKVSVSGPAKGPQVTGLVELSVEGNGFQQSQPGQFLDGGVATFSLPILPPGTYELSASYLGVVNYARAITIMDAPHGAYTSAKGLGTLTVLPAAATVTAPATLTVPVAMRSSFDAKVFVPGERLPAGWTLREGKTVLSHGLVMDGRFSVPVPVLTVGTHTLVLEVPATEFSAAGSATITVTVVGEPVRAGAAPSAALDTPKAATAPGQQMELVAEGFQPGETVAFYLHSDPVYLGTAVADANGIARLMATVPADVPVGAHTVYATGGTTGRWATLAVQLAVPAPVAVTPVSAPVAAAPAAVTPAATGAGELAVTGSEGGALGLAAAFLVAVGGALVLVTRRVRATR